MAAIQSRDEQMKILSPVMQNVESSDMSAFFCTILCCKDEILEWFDFVNVHISCTSVLNCISSVRLKQSISLHISGIQCFSFLSYSLSNRVVLASGDGTKGCLGRM
ncbi:unnamed protein product [Albugo candida]|uniref:Uncharacterized protein n=1 Tax=Albugo candida TaxID=65357 RepID=A0A024G5J8_9STRA|nr:unnamed protein product [Albugo candida]|eukprot:CCI42031.1 unnamed protein product [Albugo candida]